jgi:maltooligosyltrehalose trehalohydrolase
MEQGELGYYRAVVEDVSAGTRYSFRLDGESERPDPASRLQPEGVHGPSEVVDPSGFPWTDANWKGISLGQSVFYELHVGTFTNEGTLSAILPRLDKLADLGVTTIELMPIVSLCSSK